MRCTNQVVVVSGGGQGIGKEISLRFAAGGADVVIADISPETETTAEAVRSMGRRALALPMDLRSTNSVQDMARRTLETFGTVHALINNAGIVGAMGHIDEFSLKEWEESFAINVTGMFLTTRALLPGLKKQGGSVVNIASLAAWKPMKCRSPYCTTKAAVLGFTRSLAQDLGEFGIRVNSISPGRVEGPRIERTMHHAAAQAGLTYEAYVNRQKALAPLRSFVPPTAVADAAVFLCSKEAAFITGTDLLVTAGM